jgi:hypothetical protein
MYPKPSHQNGMTLISFLLIFVVAGFFILLTLKLMPVYLDHMKVKSSLQGLKNESGLAEKTPQEIKKMLQKRWDINSIEGITAEDNVYIEKNSSMMTIQIIYEVEKPVLGNMSALMKFDDSITVGNSN